MNRLRPRQISSAQTTESEATTETTTQTTQAKPTTEATTHTHTAATTHTTAAATHTKKHTAATHTKKQKTKSDQDKKKDKKNKKKDKKSIIPKVYNDHSLEMKDKKETIQGFIYFNQADAAWNDNGYQIKSSGCGPSAMAVCISSLTNKWVLQLIQQYGHIRMAITVVLEQVMRWSQHWHNSINWNVMDLEVMSARLEMH